MRQEIFIFNAQVKLRNFTTAPNWQQSNISRIAGKPNATVFQTSDHNGLLYLQKAALVGFVPMALAMGAGAEVQTSGDGSHW